MDSLQTILLSMKNTIEEFCTVVLSLEKLQHDGKQLAKGCCNQMNRKQLQPRIGIKPSPTNCIDGLMLLHEMHLAEYVLKSSLVSAVSALALKPNSSDLGALQQLLVDQPNILKEEDDLSFPGFVEVLWRVKPLGFGKLASSTPVPCC
ncbi:hypothetical protein CRYUN_Cryun12cG0109100 [Craigia yunnanensis]